MTETIEVRLPSPTHALRRLTFYESGSTTEINTYADPECRVPNTIPVIADKDGEFPHIYLAAGKYSVRLQEPWGENLWMVEICGEKGAE